MYNRGAGHHKGGQKGQRGTNERCFQGCNTPYNIRTKKKSETTQGVTVLCFITSNIHVPIFFALLQQFDCVSLKRGPPDDTGKWNDEECFQYRGYICQKDSGEFCIVNLEIDNMRIKITFLV